MKELKKNVEETGLGKEIGLSRGGLWTPDELHRSFEVYGIGDMITDVLRNAAGDIDPTRAHELLHCFTVAFDSAELVSKVAQDGKAIDKLDVDGSQFTPDYVKAIAVSGVFHDIALGLRQDALAHATPESELAKLVVEQFNAQPQYGKDAIGDDLRGAVLLDKYGKAIREEIRNVARAALLSEADLTVREGIARKPLGKFNPYKVEDAVAYHDGNYPVRGCAEVDMLVGDRVKLYLAGKLGDEAVGKGVKKALTYTEEDPQWEERGRKTDVAYLTKMVNKKAPGFMDAIKGTNTFDFLVAQAARERGLQTVNSPAYWAGVAQMKPALKALEGVPELAGKYGKEVETLYERLERLEKLKPAGL